MFDLELDDLIIYLAHLGIVFFHFIEFAHVTAFSIAVVISGFWAVESIFEVRKGFKKWRKNRAKRMHHQEVLHKKKAS